MGKKKKKRLIAHSEILEFLKGKPQTQSRLNNVRNGEEKPQAFLASRNTSRLASPSQGYLPWLIVQMGGNAIGVPLGDTLPF